MDAMKATHRRGSSRTSSGKAPRVRRNSVRSARARPRPGLRPPREARLRELELRVAQLEAEKLELRDACHRLEAAGRNRAKLREIAPVGLVTLDAQGTVLDINRAGAALLGRERWSLIKQRFRRPGCARGQVDIQRRFPPLRAFAGDGFRGIESAQGRR